MLSWKGSPPTTRRPVPTSEPLPTVRIPTDEVKPTAAASTLPGRDDEVRTSPAEPTSSGLGRAGISVAAVLALLAVSAILWLLLDGDDPGGTTPTATVGVIAVATDDDATEAPAPTATQAAPAPAATIPALVGLSLTEAEAIEGITLTVEEREDAAPAGTILEQEPPEGSQTQDGAVRVVVSRAPQTIEPTTIDLASLELTGLPAEEVFPRLTALGFDVLRSDVTAPETPEEQVVGFLPAEARPGDTVTVQVSRGNNAQVPFDLQGQPLDDAVASLQAEGFVVEDPLAVSREQIVAQLGPDAEFPFENQDVVGIQTDGIVVGEWFPTGTTIQLVFYDADLDQ
jgi:hypothetical protein